MGGPERAGTKEAASGAPGPATGDRPSSGGSGEERFAVVLEHADEAVAPAELDSRHRSLFETMAQGVIYLDASGAIIDANPAAEQILRKSCAELRTSAPEDLGFVVLDETGTPLDRERLPAIVALRTGAPVRGASLRIQRVGSGEIQWLSVDAIPRFRAGSREAHEVHTIFVDVTAQRQAQDALQERSSTLSGLLREMGGLVAISSAIGRAELEEAELLDFIVQTLDRVLQRPELLQVRLRLDDRLHTAGAGHPVHVLKKSEVRVDGTSEGTLEVWAVLGASVETVALDDSERDLLDAVADRIGEGLHRRRAEAARARSEAYFRSLIENASDMIEILAADGTVRYDSPSIERVLGYASTERIGRAGHLHVHPEDLDAYAALLSECGSTPGTEQRREYRVRHRDGSWRYLEVTASNRLTDPEVAGVVVHARDVTARKVAEDRIRFQAQLLDAVGEAVIARGVDGRVVYWNRAAERLHGWSAEEAIGRLLSDVASVAGARESEGLSSADDRLSTEVEVRRRDGSVVPALIVESPVTDAEGTLIGIVGIASDLTERRALQRQLLNAQKMDAVGRLAGGIAHDFNNMLMVIQGTVELMSDGMGESSEFASDLEEIRRAAGRAARLTRQLLAFSRMQILQPEILNLNGSIRGLEKMLVRLLGAEVCVELTLADDLGYIQIDPAQLEQAIVNLAINSRDAMPSGGKLCLRTENVTISPRQAAAFPYRVVPGSYVCLSVADSGIGMDELSLQRAFDPFFTTKDPGKGTGLGLSTVYGFVKQSGGYIWGSSIPGEGTVFRLHFPRVAARSNEGPEAEKEPRAPLGHGTTILVVEDESAVRAVTRRILTRSGFRILEASSGEDALRVLESGTEEIGLVITDVVMPGMSGRELAETIRQRCPNLKILFMSGYAEEEVQRRGIHVNTDHFLLKPFRPEQLLDLVAQSLQIAA